MFQCIVSEAWPSFDSKTFFRVVITTSLVNESMNEFKEMGIFGSIEPYTHIFVPDALIVIAVE